MSIAEATWDEAVRALRAARAPVLACHVGPDGDALGSMLAIALGLERIGAKPQPSFSEPFTVPEQYSFLPAQELLVKPDDLPEAPELLVTFDLGSYDRLGTLEPLGPAAETVIIVDHHVATEDAGDIRLVDPTAAASAVLARELLARLGVPLDRDIATLLYTGLVTDTGRFQYKNTTPSVHHLAAELVAAGAPHDEIATAIYATHPVGFLKVAARALDRMSVTDGVVWTWITQADLAETGIGLEHTDALIDLVRTADVADVALVMKEQPEGHYKASMRSKGATNVGAACASFGGGGHALAAGFTSDLRDPRRLAGSIIRVISAGDLPAP